MTWRAGRTASGQTRRPDTSARASHSQTRGARGPDAKTPSEKQQASGPDARHADMSIDDTQQGDMLTLFKSKQADGGPADQEAAGAAGGQPQAAGSKPRDQAGHSAQDTQVSCAPN